VKITTGNGQVGLSFALGPFACAFVGARKSVLVKAAAEKAGKDRARRSDDAEMADRVMGGHHDERRDTYL